jgi:hypothetical protein
LLLELLDPDDMALKFATKLEKIDGLSPIKKQSAIFQVPNGNYLVCYDSKHYIKKITVVNFFFRVCFLY